MSELQSLEHAFYTGDYTSVIAFDVSKLHDEEALRGRNLVQRAQIASGHARQVLESPADVAIKAYAGHVLGDHSVVESIKTPESDHERHLYALVLARSEKYPQALELLSKADQSLDCAMLAVHINLLLGNTAAASSIVDDMRSWSNDHVVFNLCEAWVSLRQNNAEAQKAYYIFEEHNGYKPTSRSHTGEAIAQLELLRVPEAAESIRRALELGQSEDTLATAVSIASIQGKTSEQLPKLQQLQHSRIVQDLKEKDELFEKVAAKYVV